MKYAGFSRNNRLVFVEEYAEFFNNVGSYLQLNSSARHLTIEIIEDNVPEKFYNYTVKNRMLEPLVDIDPEHVQAVDSLKSELIAVKNLVRRANRPYLETYGSTGIGQHLITRMKSIAMKILNNETLNDSESSLFEFHKSKFDNVDNKIMATMICAQTEVWETRLDVALLSLLKGLDSQTSGY